MHVLPPEAVLVRNERLAWRTLDERAVILFPEAGTLHRLNETGTRAWELFDGARSVADVAAMLLDEYEGTSARVVDDLQDLAGDLLEARLVELRS